VYPEVPPRVEYALTPFGRTLIEPMDVAAEWARRHMPTLMAARERYDARSVAECGEPAAGPP